MENLQADPQQNPSHATPTVVDDIPQTLNHGSSSFPSLDASRKRTRDHIPMAELHHPDNTSPETAEQPDDEKVPKIAKLNGPQEATDDNDAEEGREATGIPHHRKLKRRKIAILVAYCGVGYQGMQRNPGAKTIEGELEEALFKAGAISPEFFGNPKMLDWMRSARTDKGVSAVGQVVSGRFFIDPPGFVERVNSHLPHQIRVLGYKRVTPTFSAKKFCDRRKYEYLLPIFALDPSTHRDRESVLASEGKEGVALVKCVECSERGRKVVGVMGRRNEFGKGGVNGLGNNDELNVEAHNAELNEIPFESHDLMIAENENTDGFKDKCVGSLGGLVAETVNGFEINEKSRTMENHEKMVVDVDNEKSRTMENHEKMVADVDNEKTDNQDSVVMGGVNDNGLKGEGLENHGKNVRLIPEAGDVVHVAKNLDEGTDEIVSMEECELQKIPGGQNEETGAKSSFNYGEEERNRFNRILKKYVGTHNFHNLTTRTKAEDPSANRYILSFEASDVFNIDGMDFVRCTVLGQSFMLHQIRKMIGLAVAVMRGCAPESIIDTALRKDVHMNVPTAPELGLFLDESFFPAYNQKWQATHEEISLKGFEKQILEFKQKYIYKHIASTEAKDGVVALWLHSLNQRNYPDFVAGRETEKLKSETESSISIPQESIADKDVLAN